MGTSAALRGVARELQTEAKRCRSETELELEMSSPFQTVDGAVDSASESNNDSERTLE